MVRQVQKRHFCKTGWRKDEIASLSWAQVDKKNWIVYLNPGETKNLDGRTVYLDEELKAILESQWKARRRTETLSPYVFPARNGNSKIHDIRKAWASACKAAKLGKRLLHDFRRTAVRNMVRAGVPERVVMAVSGHRTRSVFDRYNIVSDQDLKLAALKQEEYINSEMGTISGTVHEFESGKVPKLLESQTRL